MLVTAVFFFETYWICWVRKKNIWGEKIKIWYFLDGNYCKEICSGFVLNLYHNLALCQKSHDLLKFLSYRCWDRGRGSLIKYQMPSSTNVMRDINQNQGFLKSFCLCETWIQSSRFTVDFFKLWVKLSSFVEPSLNSNFIPMMGKSHVKAPRFLPDWTVWKMNMVVTVFHLCSINFLLKLWMTIRPFKIKPNRLNNLISISTELHH